MKKEFQAQQALTTGQKVAEGASAILLLFFVHTLITTFTQRQSLENMLVFYLTENRALVSWLVLTIEAFIALLLFIPKTRRVGFIIAFAFAAGGLILITQTPRRPHHFGGIITTLAGNYKLYAYGLVACIALLGLLCSRKTRISKFDTPDFAIPHTYV
jgi:hypothetical protein